MTLKRILRGVALASLSTICLCSFNGTSTAKDELPAGLTDKMIETDIAFLQKALSKSPANNSIPTLKATAMMLALYAQTNIDGKDAAKYAAIREQALKIAAAISKNDIATARTAANAFATAKSADTKMMKLHEMNKFDLGELMSQFRAGKSGGRHIEADLKEQAKKVTDPKLVAELGARVATIAIFTYDMPDSKATGAKKKEWEKLSTEMKKLGEELSAEAMKPKPDVAVLGKKIAAINANCTACHSEFR